MKDKSNDRGWPDCPAAERMRSRMAPSSDTTFTDMCDLFDQMEREIRVHRKTFCADPSRTHETTTLAKISAEMFAALDSEQYISSETCDLINHFEREFDKVFPPEGGQ